MDVAIFFRAKCLVETSCVWKVWLQLNIHYPWPLFTLSWWSNICNSILKYPKAKSFLNARIKFIIGKGSKVFPRFFKLASNSLTTVGDLGLWDGMQWTWSISWIRFLIARDLQDFEVMNMLLNKSHLSLEDNDALIWTPHKTGQFRSSDCV